MSERRSVEGLKPDGVVPAGQEGNPNPPDQVAANRARFEEVQRQLQADREHVIDAVEPLQAGVEAQFQRSMNDPAHQVVIPEQIAHGEADPVHGGGGKSHDRQPFEIRNTPLNPEVNVPLPVPLADRNTRTGETPSDDVTPGA